MPCRFCSCPICRKPSEDGKLLDDLLDQFTSDLKKILSTNPENGTSANAVSESHKNHSKDT